MRSPHAWRRARFGGSRSVWANSRKGPGLAGSEGITRVPSKCTLWHLIGHCSDHTTASSVMRDSNGSCRRHMRAERWRLAVVRTEPSANRPSMLRDVRLLLLVAILFAVPACSSEVATVPRPDDEADSSRLRESQARLADAGGSLFAGDAEVQFDEPLAEFLTSSTDFQGSAIYHWCRSERNCVPPGRKNCPWRRLG